MSTRQHKFDVFKLETGTLLLEKEYDNTGQVMLYCNLKMLDYDRHITVASGEAHGEFIKDLDSLIAALQTIRQETIGVEENPF